MLEANPNVELNGTAPPAEVVAAEGAAADGAGVGLSAAAIGATGANVEGEPVHAGVGLDAAAEDRVDRELVAAFRGGDRGALEKLYVRHAERIWRYGRYFSGREDVAAEIVQETFLRVIKYVKGYEGRSRFSTWLFTLARSAAVQEVNRRRDRGESPLTDENSGGLAGGSGGVDPAAAAETVELRRTVREAVALLPDAEREALVLFELEGLSGREAGEVLGWNEAKVKSVVFRARRRLREMLRPVLGETGPG